jgi:hypothetical protein
VSCRAPSPKGGRGVGRGGGGGDFGPLLACHVASLIRIVSLWLWHKGMSGAGVCVNTRRHRYFKDDSCVPATEILANARYSQGIAQ